MKRHGAAENESSDDTSKTEVSDKTVLKIVSIVMFGLVLITLFINLDNVILAFQGCSSDGYSLRCTYSNSYPGIIYPSNR